MNLKEIPRLLKKAQCHKKALMKASQIVVPDYVGKRFGRLIVLGDGTQATVAVRCDCGVHKMLHRSDVLTHKVKSCGCLWQERLSVGARSQAAENLALKYG